MKIIRTTEEFLEAVKKYDYNKTPLKNTLVEGVTVTDSYIYLEICDGCIFRNCTFGNIALCTVDSKKNNHVEIRNCKFDYIDLGADNDNDIGSIVNIHDSYIKWKLSADIAKLNLFNTKVNILFNSEYYNLYNCDIKEIELCSSTRDTRYLSDSVINGKAKSFSSVIECMKLYGYTISDVKELKNIIDFSKNSKKTYFYKVAIANCNLEGFDFKNFVFRRSDIRRCQVVGCDFSKCWNHIDSNYSDYGIRLFDNFSVKDNNFGDAEKKNTPDGTIEYDFPEYRQGMAT